MKIYAENATFHVENASSRELEMTRPQDDENEITKSNKVFGRRGKETSVVYEKIKLL